VVLHGNTNEDSNIARYCYPGSSFSGCWSFRSLASTGKNRCAGRFAPPCEVAVSTGKRGGEMISQPLGLMRHIAMWLVIEAPWTLWLGRLSRLHRAALPARYD
jgi:hypothetical protein